MSQSDDVRNKTLAYSSPGRANVGAGETVRVAPRPWAAPPRPKGPVAQSTVVIREAQPLPPVAEPVDELAAALQTERTDPPVDVHDTTVDPKRALALEMTMQAPLVGSTLDTDATMAAPLSSSPGSFLPISVSPTSGSVRVTVLPRVEMFGEHSRIVSESRLRYVHEKKLGEGGLGEVLGAVDQDIGRKVAVKRLRTEVRSDAALIRFAEEIRTIGKLEHPNIVPIHDVGVDEQGDHYFVMKYVDGETLETIIEKLAAGDPAYQARYTVERRVEMFVGLLEAVAFSHAQGIIHRDIKPANVMVGAYGEVVLMDWGVAKIRGNAPALPGGEPPPQDRPRTPFQTQVGAIVGTPFYMSPEQAQGLPVDERSDIYSLCLLFRELLTLEHPLASKTTLDEVIQAVIAEPMPSAFLSRHENAAPIPCELLHFVGHGLDKDPAKRFANVGQMLERLRNRAAGEIVVECPVTYMKSKTSKWTRFVDRHPFVAVSLVGMGVLGLLASTTVSIVLALT